MDANSFTLRVADSPVLIEMARVLMAEYAALPHTTGRWTTVTADIAALPRPYVPPMGIFLIALRAGVSVPQPNDDASGLGCGGLLALDTPGDAEIKRVYVRPTARGQGIGEAITRELMYFAE